MLEVQQQATDVKQMHAVKVLLLFLFKTYRQMWQGPRPLLELTQIYPELERVVVVLILLPPARHS